MYNIELLSHCINIHIFFNHISQILRFMMLYQPPSDPIIFECKRYSKQKKRSIFNHCERKEMMHLKETIFRLKDM